MTKLNSNNNTYPQNSPQDLYRKVSNKKFPFYQHKTDDIGLCELEKLKQKYLNTLSLEDKTALLMKERELLYEELEHPELTLARNYNNLKDMLKKMKVCGKQLDLVIETLNLHALLVNESTLSMPQFISRINKKEYNSTISKEKIIDLLQKTYKSASENHKDENFINPILRTIYFSINKISPFPKKISKTLHRFNERTRFY